MKEPFFRWKVALHQSEDDTKTYFALEGEHKVVAIFNHELNAVTSSGSKNSNKANWDSLKGHTIRNWPDKDNPCTK